MPLNIKTSITFVFEVKALVSNEGDTGYKQLCFHLNDMSGPGIDIIIPPMDNTEVQMKYIDALNTDLANLLEAFGQLSMEQINKAITPVPDRTKFIN